MKTELTHLEKQAMINIAESEYANVSTIDELVDYPVWSFSVTNNSKSIAGAIGSLVKKQLAQCQTEDGDETVCLTKLGVELLKSFYCFK